MYFTISPPCWHLYSASHQQRRSHRPTPGLVGEDAEAGGADKPGADQPQLRARGPVAEEALTGSEHDRIDHESVFVDQVVLDQGPNEAGAPGNKEVPRHLLLEPPDL